MPRSIVSQSAGEESRENEPRWTMTRFVTPPSAVSADIKHMSYYVYVPRIPLSSQPAKPTKAPRERNENTVLEGKTGEGRESRKGKKRRYEDVHRRKTT